MNCENIEDLILPLIHRELPGEQRIRVINHLQSCEACRNEFYLQLKLSYGLMKEMVKPAVIDFAVESSVLRAKQPEAENRIFGIYRRNAWITMAAAAVLLCLILIWPFRLNLNQPENPAEITSQQEISELLQAEDWSALIRIITNNAELDKHKNDKIPLTLLESKLAGLDTRSRRRLETVIVETAPATVRKELLQFIAQEVSGETSQLNRKIQGSYQKPVVSIDELFKLAEKINQKKAG
jgi:hypothetical protein